MVCTTDGGGDEQLSCVGREMGAFGVGESKSTDGRENILGDWAIHHCRRHEGMQQNNSLDQTTTKAKLVYILPCNTML